MSTSLAGCFESSLPSQQHPTCSWESTVPANSHAVCTTIVKRLQTLVAAVAAGNEEKIRQIVIDPGTRRKIIRWSRTTRAAGGHGIHLVPSVAIDMEANGRIGAGFYVLGNTRKDRINSQETLYFKRISGQEQVVASDPDKEW